jgi:hypothetical protein
MGFKENLQQTMFVFFPTQYWYIKKSCRFSRKNLTNQSNRRNSPEKQWFQMVPVKISRTLEPTPGVGVGTIYAAVQLVCWGPSH